MQEVGVQKGLFQRYPWYVIFEWSPIRSEHAYIYLNNKTYFAQIKFQKKVITPAKF